MQPFWLSFRLAFAFITKRQFWHARLGIWSALCDDLGTSATICDRTGEGVSEKYALNDTADDLCSALCDDLGTSATICDRPGAA